MKMSTTGRETSCDQSASLQEDATQRWQWVVIGCGDEQRPGQSWKRRLRVDCVRVYTNKSAAEADLVTLKFVLRLLRAHCARGHLAPLSMRFFVLSTSLSRALLNISRGRRLSPLCYEGGEGEAWHGYQDHEGLDAELHRTEDGIWDQPVCAALTTDTVIHDASNMTAK